MQQPTEPMFAGKSSLLDILSGRREGAAVKARLTVNGTAVSPSQMRAASGYVHQVCPLRSLIGFIAYSSARAMAVLHCTLSQGQLSTSERPAVHGR